MKKGKIKVTKNDLYIISGEINLQKQVTVADSDGTAAEWKPSTNYKSQEKYALCRCRQSKNKPFCDDSHYQEAETAEKVHEE